MYRLLELEKHFEYFYDALADLGNTAPVDELGQDVAVAYDDFVENYSVAVETFPHFVVVDDVVGIVANAVSHYELEEIEAVMTPLSPHDSLEVYYWNGDF